MGQKAINIYEYFYDSKGRPVVTICTTKHTNDVCTRGISICGLPDIKNGTFCKARGRIIARNRSFLALDQHKNSGKVQSSRAIDIYEDVAMWKENGPLFKSQYNVLLTSHQSSKIIEILMKWEERNNVVKL